MPRSFHSIGIFGTKGDVYLVNYVNNTINHISAESSLINKIALFFILLDNVYVPVDLGFDFRVQYLLYTLFIFFYIVYYRKVRLSAKTFIQLTAIFLLLALIPIVKSSGYLPFMKQSALIFFNLLFAFALVNAYKFDIKKLFLDYVDLIFLASIVGAVQMISFVIGFKYGADFSYLGFDMYNLRMNNWKIQSWFQEPSFLAYAFLPVIFVCISRLFNITKVISKGKAIFIITVFILSLSSVGLVGLLIALVIVVNTKYSIFRKPHIAIVLLTVVVLTGWGFYSIPQVKLRVDDSAKLFFDDRITKEDINKANLSTYALFTNFRVTVASFKDNVLLGTGLGTYESTYDKYIGEVIPRGDVRKKYEMNKKDANSMLFRLTSEVGLIGLFLLTIFLIGNRVSINLKVANDFKVEYWMISNGILVLFLARLLRQGHYTMLGFAVFVILYFLAKNESRNLKYSESLLE